MNIPKYEDTEPIKQEIPRYEDTTAHDGTSSSTSEPSTLESFGGGIKSGVDPFRAQTAGASQSAFDILAKMGLLPGVKRSVSSTNAMLAQPQGPDNKPFTGAGGVPLADQSVGDIYSSGRDSEREQMAAESEAHPIANIAGGLVGGAAIGGPLTKGLGAVGGGLAKVAGKVMPQGVAELSTAAQMYPRLASIAKAGAAGAGIGAAYGGGDTGTLEGTIHGAQTGALTGGALRTAGETLGALRDVIRKGAQNSSMGGVLQQTARGAERGLEGENIFGQAASDKTGRQVTAIKDKLFKELSDNVSDEWSQKIEAIQARGQQMSVDDYMKVAEQTIQDQINNKKILPSEAEGVKSELYEMMYNKLPEKLKDTVNSISKKVAVKTPKYTQEQIDAAAEAGKDLPDNITETTWKGKVPSEELQQHADQLPPEHYQPKDSQIKDNPKAEVVTDTSQAPIPSAQGAAPTSIGPTQVPEADMAKTIRGIGDRSGNWDANKPPASADTMQEVYKALSDKFAGQMPQNINENTEALQTLFDTQKSLGGPEKVIKSTGDVEPKGKAYDFIKSLFGYQDSKVLENRDNIFNLLDKIDPKFAANFRKEATQAVIDDSTSKEFSKAGFSSLGSTVRSTMPASGWAIGQGLRGLGGIANAAGKVGIRAPQVTTAGVQASTHGREPTSQSVTNIASWPTDRLQRMSQTLKAEKDPASQRLGQMIDGISSGDQNKRAAMLFSISQNKDYRDIITRVQGVE